MTEENLNGMKLTKVLKAWMDSEGWEDDIETNLDQTKATVSTSMIVDGQSFKLFLEVEEPAERFYVYFYSPYNVSTKRADVIALILNRINRRLALGRLAFDDGPEASPIQLQLSVDVEGAALSTIQVRTLLGVGVGTWRTYGSLLAMAALSNRSLDDLWAEFQQQEEDCTSGWGSSCCAPRVLQ